MKVRKFTVKPLIPETLADLNRLARNLWWTWNSDARALFARLDPDLFETTAHNPVKILGVIPQERLNALCEDAGFLAHLERVVEAFDQYLNESQTWFSQQTVDKPASIAYFSAEYGLHESLPIYSGGLGVLAGDHLKSASDLGLPLVAVGLLYQQGYFRQYLNADGWQQELYPENDFYNMVCEKVLSDKGEPVKIKVEFPGREVVAQVWKVAVGRIPLYLLDTNVPENRADDQAITSQLYGGDQDMRVRQEMVLGIGGARALEALKISPTVFHMNEGHSAFLALENTARIMKSHKVDFDTARQAVSAGCVFTTHTPVEAGNDMFPPYLIDEYLTGMRERLTLDHEEFHGLGRQNPKDSAEPFCMTVLALRFANSSNGVSKLHGEVSRRMWRRIWPELPEHDVPIQSITNGIHIKSMLNPEIAQLYDRYLGTGWQDQPANHEIWGRCDKIPDAELWRMHERQRERLVVYARERVKMQMRRRGVSESAVAGADEIFDPSALTIGFARRFATYKRGTLIFRDLDRLTRLVNNADRPVQFVFSGKAHPRDHGGKELIAHIFHVARRDDLFRRIVFLEDYDLAVARYLVQGVDVWLNNPRRPLEASGTSGMKVPINGGLNISILDGWWVEGFKGDNGWAIGNGEEYSDLNYQDDVESRALYELLEEELVPLFYNRGADGLPRPWIKRMKRSIATVCPAFNTNRMVQQYATNFYLPGSKRHYDLSANQLQGSAHLAKWLKRAQEDWDKINVCEVREVDAEALQVGSSLTVQAVIDLGDLQPTDVQVEIYHGNVDAHGNIREGVTEPMAVDQAAPTVEFTRPTMVDDAETQATDSNGVPGDGVGADGSTSTAVAKTKAATAQKVLAHQFVGTIQCQHSGRHGYAVRVLPKHELLSQPYQPGLIRWS